jgi:arsenical pump membrane protein
MPDRPGFGLSGAGHGLAVPSVADPTRPPPASHRLERGLAVLGAVAVVVALALAPRAALSAASQVWPAFVLVAGLLLVGLVAHQDGLFATGGHALARLSRRGPLVYASSCVLVVVVTSLLNLDTSVTFLTPVLLYAARRRGQDTAPLLYASVLLSNAGSLLLPGSNLTNLIVLGHLHLSGRTYFDELAPAGAAAAVVTAFVVGVVHRRQLRTTIVAPEPAARPVLGVGLVAVAGVTVLVLALRAPALPVAAVGLAATMLRWRRHGEPSPSAAVRQLGAPVLAGLFGLAVALGTLGRQWSGPEMLLTHLDTLGTTAVAALSSVLVNNLPAASLLAARRPPHPTALLVGLNVGPNLFVTGSLAWFLWLRAARQAGVQPDLRRACTLGLLSAPLAMLAAVGVLAGGH